MSAVAKKDNQGGSVEGKLDKGIANALYLLFFWDCERKGSG